MCKAMSAEASEQSRAHINAGSEHTLLALDASSGAVHLTTHPEKAPATPTIPTHPGPHHSHVSFYSPMG